ncbi:hypothetical protein [Persicobacter diffluens]|uniref:Uncharacterized protein n=1 Tax=Persicobacter diffluens TaxID=981 RepID=A0AAN4VYG9_9BACT|nr:hypothetical protein PEDI_12320 [Persicobacter diffluens]
MQRHVIFLTNGMFSTTTRFGLIFIVGLFLVLTGAFNLSFFGGLDGLYIVLNIIALVAGAILLIDAWLLRPGSDSMPRVEVDDHHILVVNDELVGKEELWPDEIASIQLAAYEIIVDYKEKERLIISINTEDVDTSKDVKMAVKEFCEVHNIPLSGG